MGSFIRNHGNEIFFFLIWVIMTAIILAGKKSLSSNVGILYVIATIIIWFLIYQMGKCFGNSCA